MKKQVFSWMVTVAVLSCLMAAAQASSKNYTNSIGMKFVLIPSGSFMMGADLNFEDGYKNETPQHRVTISRAFYLGKYEVTQQQWVKIMGNNSSKFKGRTRPVEQVSWNDAQRFINKLNAAEGGKHYRLPTEAEWEYACRAGTDTAYSFGDDADQLGNYAWFDGNSGNKTHPVGQRQANPWGLHDMHGNVWEWVQDIYAEKAYGNHSGRDPIYTGSGSNRVDRGGSWYSSAGYTRCANRDNGDPGGRYSNLGFRVARTP